MGNGEPSILCIRGQLGPIQSTLYLSATWLIITSSPRHEALLVLLLMSSPVSILSFPVGVHPTYRPVLCPHCNCNNFSVLALTRAFLNVMLILPPSSFVLGASAFRN